MGTKKTRTRVNKRDRRLAKESGWKRPGRQNPKKIGHGGSGQGSAPLRMPKVQIKEQKKRVQPTVSEIKTAMADHFRKAGIETS